MDAMNTVWVGEGVAIEIVPIKLAPGTRVVPRAEAGIAERLDKVEKAVADLRRLHGARPGDVPVDESRVAPGGVHWLVPVKDA